MGKVHRLWAKKTKKNKKNLKKKTKKKNKGRVKEE